MMSRGYFRSSGTGNLVAIEEEVKSNNCLVFWAKI